MNPVDASPTQHTGKDPRRRIARRVGIVPRAADVTQAGNATGTPFHDRRRPVPVRAGSVLMLAAAGVVGAMAFLWPLVVRPSGAEQYATQAPFMLGGLLVVVVLLVLVDLSSRAIDVKALALLGVLTAIGAVLRPLGAGTAGIELVFFLVILGGRVFGPGFGFAQGVLTLFVSGLLTGGVGPWLPYQMIATGFVGLVAGVLPPAARGLREIALLCGWGAVSAFLFGLAMDFAFWPYATGMHSQLSWDPQASVWHNLHTFLLYTLATSLAWNIGRAITNVTALAVVGPGVLRVLRRANRRAFFVDED